MGHLAVTGSRLLSGRSPDAEPHVRDLREPRRSMHYRVFYFFEGSGESVTSTRPVDMSARSIREELLHRLDSDDDYLGIIDARDNVLQIMRDPGSNRYWVELPLEEARASYGRFMAFAEIEALVLGLPRVLDRSAIPGMEYRPWW